MQCATLKPRLTSGVFAWQGFSLSAGDDWRPTVLSGDWRRGYVLLEDSRAHLLQIRWQTCKKQSLAEAQQRYLDSLSASSKKKGQALRYRIEGPTFEWTGPAKGYGMALECGSRLFLAELSGPTRDSFKTAARRLLADFQAVESDKAAWSVYGLSVELPTDYQLDTFKFVTGMTALKFRSKGARLMVERWGLAAQLLAKRSLAGWLETLAGAPAQPISDSDAHASRTLRLGGTMTALARFQPELNQITVLRASHRLGKEPQWDWFA